MPTHTPGPWSVGKHSRKVFSQDNGKEIAMVFDKMTNPTFYDGEPESNARLIAAAPAMREALQECEVMLLELRDNDDTVTEEQINAQLSAIYAALDLAAGKGANRD